MAGKETVENTAGPVGAFSLFTDFDIHLFRSGKHFKLYEKFGAHAVNHNGVDGTYFAVWAPNAGSVSIIGDFNQWQEGQSKMSARWDESGIWEAFFPGIAMGQPYKYAIHSSQGSYLEKADPYAGYAEIAPKTASITWESTYIWKDKDWLRKRKDLVNKPQPFAVYEVHSGSWRRKQEEGNRSLSYREMADTLVAYVKEMGFTHVEFMPVMEHPFFGSWGYQLTGYFAPTSRFGSPDDFKHLIDSFHQSGIGVILDWVPSHFPGDAHGLFTFDGTHLYEHADPRKGYHPDWTSYIYNYDRPEVRSFLISNALYWLDKFHIDGLRVDAVASMLYLDYSRKAGEWLPNQSGGNENMEAIQFLKEFNETVYANFPDVITIAEESTAWTGVSRPTYLGGLGFGQKWMMGWMHDTLRYFKNDPIHRKYHQNDITFSLMYAFTENFMLPLSHDEVVHGKGSLIGKMPGDPWRKFANLRLLYGYMYSHPGTKLLFMGGEFGQVAEWNHDRSLDWHLLDQPMHRGMMELVKGLNRLYSGEPALYAYQFDGQGFEWVDYNDRENSVIIYKRIGTDPSDTLLVVGNFTPESKSEYRIGVPTPGTWQEIFNTDDELYGGSGVGNKTAAKTSPIKYHSRDHSIAITLPPLGLSIFKRVAEANVKSKTI
ncbi:MAG: 1,4-alpha-glucan branching protein GlgB [Cytophagales bacterium]|nr:1,4-alpha-glucan branching protein GlgB [Cytophagales bacterium]